MPRRMLTSDEAADYLGTTVRHIRRLVSDHELSRYKVGGRIRFADVDLDEWLDARRVQGGPSIAVPPARSPRSASTRQRERE